MCHITKAWNNYIPPPKIPPSPRFCVAMNYIESIDSLLVFGGALEEEYYNDIWLFDLNEGYWQALVLSSAILPGSI